jgi:CrcB protein
MNLILVILGGAIGASLRYLVSKLFIYGKLITFPYATLSVNVLGSFLMGFLAYYLINRYSGQENLRLFLLTGLLGGFTTFSAFSLETLQLLTIQRYWSAILYIMLSLILSLIAVAAGFYLSRAFH